MTTTGDFNYFLDGESKTFDEIRQLINIEMTVSVEGLNVYYFSPKIAKVNLKNRIIEYNGIEYYNVGFGLTPKMREGEKQPNSLAELVEITKQREIGEEKNKTEKLVFTTLEKELTSEKQQGHLSTRHKKSAPMFLDEFLEDFSEKDKEIKANYCQVTADVEQPTPIVTYTDSYGTVINDYYATINARPLDTNFRNYTEYPITPEESFKVGDTYWKSITKTGELKEEVFPQQGIKETVNKTDYSEVNLGVLDLMAERFTANKHKYPKGNSLKAIDVKDLCWALFRHVKKMIKEENNDPETFKDHLGAILCNGSMILDQLEIENRRETIEQLLNK